MRLPEPLDTLSPDDQLTLAERMEPVRFPEGTCIFRAGSAGDGFYIIDEGEVRLELERPGTDIEGVLQVLEPGTMLGELSLLDRLPRSASAYAETDVVARRISAGAIEQLSETHPRIANAVLRAIGRDAALKLRKTTDRLVTFIEDERPDPMVEETVARAAAAQRAVESWGEERVDAMLRGIAEAVASRAAELAEATVAETKMGSVADKARKNVLASVGIFQSLAGRQGAGLLAEDEARRVSEYAAPAGVIFGLVPMTAPVATAVFKTLIALKGRNAIILSAHRRAAGVSNAVGELIRGVLREHGAPEDLVQLVRGRTSRRLTARFMAHPKVALVLATGGAAMVRAAYSSGTPAIGVGPGNTPTWVTAGADAERAAQAVVLSKSFDNGLICACEHNLVVDASVRERFVAALQAAGAAVLTPSESRRFVATVADPSGHGFRAEVIGQSADRIAAFIGVKREYPIQLLVVPTEGATAENPLAGEKLSPFLSLFTVSGVEEGLATCKALLAVDGAGHTAVIHASDPATIDRFAREIPAGRILVNSPALHGAIGNTSGLVPSFTLGCGTFGGNSTTDNVSYRNLINVKRLAHYVAPVEAPPSAAPSVAAAAVTSATPARV